MTSPTTPPRARRRKIPLTVLAALGGGAALTFGVTAAKLTFSAPLVVLTLGGIVLVLCGAALHRMLEPLLRPEGATPAVAQVPVRVRDLEREKQAVLKAIREIELDFQMRKISESDYREMTQRYRTRAMRLIREIDAGDNYAALIEAELKSRLAAQATAPASRPCAACGTANDADARFCKSCAAKLSGDAGKAAADGQEPA